MRLVGGAACVALLLAVAQAIRTLKEGPMIDAEGREYKSFPALAPEAPEAPEDAGGARGAQLGSGSGSGSGRGIRVQCTDRSMVVSVGAELLRRHGAVAPEEVFLGEPRCRAVAAADGHLVIEVELQDCGSTSRISGEALIYSNQLVIAPLPRSRSITRLPRAVIPVSCLYRRTQFVSTSPQPSDPGRPSSFSLLLLADDWRSETSSRVFYLGDILRLQASYTGPDSSRRRLFIDSCVATLSPDTTSVPRYYFVENHGCLTDAQQGGRDTLFRPRQRAHTLQLQLNAFLFQQEARNSIFFTCQLKATSQLWQSSPINKACNYKHSRWTNVDGHDDVCRCCDRTCYTSSPTWHNKPNTRLSANKDVMTCATLAIGPLVILPSK